MNQLSERARRRRENASKYQEQMGTMAELIQQIAIDMEKEGFSEGGAKHEAEVSAKNVLLIGRVRAWQGLHPAQWPTAQWPAARWS